MGEYHQPTFRAKAFTCPFCQAFAQVNWITWSRNAHFTIIEAAKCSFCNNYTYWFGDGQKELKGKLLYPMDSGVPAPNPDMPDEVKKNYIEASLVLPHSTRAAAALLRLALQHLCIHLNKSKNINIAIGQLVEDGLLPGVQKALDTIRIVGNECVHPGEITDDDLDKTVGPMFNLMNLIVDDRISRFKQVEAIYESLPESKRQGVEHRDARK
nr:DUF4145 domain-containing protein [Halomonas sp.]